VSAADVDLLREMWEEMNRSFLDGIDREAAERWWHPEIEYVEDPQWPGSRTYRGRDEVIDTWNGYLDVLNPVELKIEDLIDAGDQVVALVRISGVSKGADVPFEHVWAYVCRVDDGQLTYQRAYWDADEALSAAGVSSP
jgi:ketosteroid isomerase-like protein